MAQKNSPSKPTLSEPYNEAEKRTAQDSPRVAESVATYHVPRKSVTDGRQLVPSKQIAGYSASDEVWQFAVENELISHLETAIRLVHVCFPTVYDVQLFYEIDWEAENNSWIAIEIKVTGAIDDILTQYNQFTV